MGISLVLLAYKEAENLEVLLPQMKEKLEECKEDYEILVIDTATPLDNTEEVCKKYGARYINQEKPGFGGAFCTGIKYAEKDKFLIMDSDGSHPTAHIPEIHRMFISGNYDVVIGSRYTKGGKTNDAALSIIMSKILNTIFRICLGISAKDISTDYRMYHTAQLKAITLTCENYDVLQEVLLGLKLAKPDKRLVIGEVPISFQKRLFGETKRQLVKFIISYIKTLYKLTKMHIHASFK